MNRPFDTLCIELKRVSQSVLDPSTPTTCNKSSHKPVFWIVIELPPTGLLTPGLKTMIHLSCDAKDQKYGKFIIRYECSVTDVSGLDILESFRFKKISNDILTDWKNILVAVKQIDNSLRLPKRLIPKLY